MSARRRNLHRPFDVLLPLHVRKVVFVVIQTFVESVAHVNASGFDGNPFVEKVDDLFDVGGTEDVYALHDGGFPRILDGQNHPLLLVFASLQCDRQCPPNRLERAVQRQFAQNVVIFQLRRTSYLLRCGQNADGQRQVVCRALFADVGRRHVDHNLTARNTIIIDIQRGFNPLLTFFHRAVGQTD